MKNKFICCCMIFIAWLAIAKQIQAKNDITIEPTFQEIVVENNDNSIKSKIRLINTSDSEQIYQVYAVDIQQFDQNGNVILADKPLTGTEYSLASFLILDKNKYVIAGNSAVDIDFSVKNDTSLSPGGHYAALVARLATDDQSKQQVLPAISSFILVRKNGGEQLHLSINQITELKNWLSFSAPKKLTLNFSNQGNVHVVPKGTVLLKDIFGNVIYKGLINDGSLFVLPGTKRDIEVKLQKLRFASPLMLYSVLVNGDTQQNSIKFSQQGSIIIVSPLLILSLIVALSLIIYIKLLKKK